jgi:hypothetical protein
METILSLLSGGLLRFLPELLKLFTLKQDNSHELAMMDKQIELQKLNADNAYRVQEKQVDSAEILALMDAQKSALAGQMQKTGFMIVDALNFLVRPLTTYYFLGCYGIVKTAMIVVALRLADPWSAIIHCWSLEDANILSSILAFWFVGRVFDKQK